MEVGNESSGLGEPSRIVKEDRWGQGSRHFKGKEEAPLEAKFITQSLPDLRLSSSDYEEIGEKNDFDKKLLF